jgi:glucokinase
VVALTRVVLGVVLLADPEAIVIGGGMAAAGSVLTEPVIAGLRGALLWRTPPRVLLSCLGGDSGALGAALLAWDATPVDDLTR